MADKYTSRTITTLDELKPGDHIRVPAGLNNKRVFSSTPVTTLASVALKSHISHHLMVVRVIDEHTIQVIHKTRDGVIEERMHYRPEDITVLVYESIYTGQVAIQNARQMTDEKYEALKNNCEHFVFKARTGKKQGEQVSAAAVGGLANGIVGAVKGARTGGSVGATIGLVAGSVVPGVGNVCGVVVGGVVGGLVGAIYGGGHGTAKGTVKGLESVNAYQYQ